MKNFSKAIEATCFSCYITETVRTETIKEAKVILQEHYGWSKSNDGWICTECSQK